MESSRGKIIFRNVAPAILFNACVFLFSVVDGIFVGNGAGNQALGAVNLALPFVLLAQALNAMSSIGGVTITAIRFGRGDKEGAQNAFMHSLTLNLIAGVLITLYRTGQRISIIGSTLCVAVYVLFPHRLCQLFGASGETLEFTSIHMWEYCWGFIVGSMNTMMSAYLYSTKRSGQAIALNIVRSLVMNSLIITLLPMIFGSAIVWHTFGIYEVVVLLVAIVLKKSSERSGIVYK